MAKVILIDGQLIATRFPVTSSLASNPDKYDIAARVALAGLDDGEWRKLSAAQQREVFGAYLFGRKDIWVSTEGQGTVRVRWLGAWEGTHSSWAYETVTLEQVARAVRGDKANWPL